MASLKNKHFMIGLTLTFIVALFSFLAAKLPILDKVGALTIAILIAILYLEDILNNIAQVLRFHLNIY